MADYAKEIQHLEAIINGATTSVSADGLTTTFDLAAAKQRLAELRRMQGDGRDKVKHKVNSVDLSNCW